MKLLDAIGQDPVDAVRDALAGSPSRAERTEALFHASYTHGNEAVCLLLLEGEVDPKWRDSFGRTLVHGGANRGLERVFERVLALDIDPRVADEMGDTALHCAGAYGTARIVEARRAAGSAASRTRS